jgi:DinB superfamily
MDPISMFKMQIETAHGIVEGTMNGVDEKLCQKLPEGEAHPIGATYAHTVCGEDFLINMALRGGKAPLMMGEWAGKTGVSEPPPAPGGDLLAWAKKVQVDLAQARKYAQAVYANTNAYVGSLSAADLDEEMDIPGFGKHPRAYFLNMIAVIHPSNHCGEIAALKGMNGVRGYPF